MTVVVMADQFLENRRQAGSTAAACYTCDCYRLRIVSYSRDLSGDRVGHVVGVQETN